MENTAKNFALQLGSLISLYISLGSLIALLFGVITIQYPDPAQGGYEFESATSSIRFSIAMLVIFFPTYLTLTRLVNNIRRKEQGMYLTLTKWLIYLSLLVGGGVILGDLVTVLYNFLNGEITIRFILKALAVLVVIGSAFVYYLFDARGYWQTHEKESIQYGVGACVLVCIFLILGFTRIGTPAEVRERNIDSTQVQTLQDMQYRIEEAYRVDATLPKVIDQVFVGSTVPLTEKGRAAYTYTVIGTTTYELCAEFAFPSTNSQSGLETRPVLVADEFMQKNPYTWDHGAGKWCFEREITMPPDIPQFIR